MSYDPWVSSEVEKMGMNGTTWAGCTNDADWVRGDQKRKAAEASLKYWSTPSNFGPTFSSPPSSYFSSPGNSVSGSYQGVGSTGTSRKLSSEEIQNFWKRENERIKAKEERRKAQIAWVKRICTMFVDAGRRMVSPVTWTASKLKKPANVIAQSRGAKKVYKVLHAGAYVGAWSGIVVSGAVLVYMISAVAFSNDSIFGRLSKAFNNKNAPTIMRETTADADAPLKMAQKLRIPKSAYKKTALYRARHLAQPSKQPRP